MKVKYLTVPKDEEARVIAAGAWYDRRNSVYAYTKYQNENDFKGMESGVERDLNDLSLSMACNFMNFDRKAAQEFLIRDGYLNADDKLPTEKGKAAGLQVKTGIFQGREASYATYSDEFLDKVLWPQRSALKKNLSRVSRGISQTFRYMPAASYSCTRYKKLRVPDNVLFVSVTASGKTRDAGITGLAAANIRQEVLIDQTFTPPVTFASVYDQFITLCRDCTLAGHNLPLIRRLLVQSTEQNNLDPEPLLQAFSRGADCMEVAQTYLASSRYDLKSICRMLGIPWPDVLSARQKCLLDVSILNALEDRPFIPLSQALSESVPSSGEPNARYILQLLEAGNGIDGAVEESGMPTDKVRKIFLSALKQRIADPQWVMTLEREQELFTFIKQHPDWNGKPSSLRKLVGTQFTAFEVDTSLADWRFVKSLERIRQRNVSQESRS